MRFRLIVASIVLLQALLIYQFVAQRFPLSGDDHSYLYQARLFASGRFYAEDALYDYRHPLHACIETNCLRDDGGRRFSKYAPGWPAVLSLGVLLHVPWLVQPLLAAALTYILLAYVRRTIGASAEKTAALLLGLCVFWAYYGASYRPHMVTALALFGAFLAFERAMTDRQSAATSMALAAALLGFSTLIRYTDWIPLGVWMVYALLRARRIGELLLFGTVFALVAAGNLAYGWMLSGQLFVVPTHLGGTVGDHDQLTLSWTGVVFTLARLAMLCWVFPPVLLLVRGWTAARRADAARARTVVRAETHSPGQVSDWLLLALFAGNVAVYALFAAAPAGPGPRYFLPYFPFLVIAVVSLRERLIAHGRLARHLWRGLIVAQVAGSAIFVAREAYTLNGRRDVERTVMTAGLLSPNSAPSAVLLTSGTYHTDARDLTMNAPELDAAGILYFSSCNPADVEALRKRFGDRQWFTYSYPGTLVASR